MQASTNAIRTGDDGMEHKRNHYVPQFILRGWVTRGLKYSGVWVYDIREERSFFSNATGAKAFSFAATDDLYVPKIDGKRSASMEKWFGGQESALSKVVREALQKRDILTDRATYDELAALTFALVGLEHRSRHEIEASTRAVRDDPDLRKIISSNPERDIHRLVLENIINDTTNTVQELGHVEITFFETENSLICSDRPAFLHDEIGHFVVLTNHCFAVYHTSSAGLFRYRHEQARADFVESVDRALTFAARDWIVADSEQNLNRHIEVIKTSEWKEHVARDHPVVKPVTALTAGWNFREPND